MKFLRAGLILLGVAIIFSGCSSTDDAKKRKEEIAKIKKIKDNLDKMAEKDKMEAKKFASSQGMNYFKALKARDYDAFCKSKKLSKNKFYQWHAAVTKAYGKLESQEYIGSISNPLVIRYMWKWKFTRKTKDGKPVTREALYNVFIAKDKESKKYVLFTTGLQ
jgi:hypothetical protein